MCLLVFIVELKPAFVDGNGELRSQYYLEVFLSPCSDFHDIIMPVFNAVPPQGLKIRDIQY